MNNQRIKEIYNEVIKKYHELGLNQGMAVFYTTVKYNPELLLIGDNLGGDNGKIWKEPPKKHDYFLNEEDDYPFAKKMRLIFTGNKLETILKESVKINRVFFQSVDKKSLNQKYGWDNLEKFCLPVIEEIVQIIEPKIIMAESVGTFNYLITNFKGSINKEPLVYANNKVLLMSGRINDIPLLGIRHPTGSWGNSNKDWELVTMKLLEIFNSKR